MNIWEVVLRIMLAMVIGLVIGGERDHAHRPAGMRTHMLVAIGSAVIMILGEYIFNTFEGRTNADPARLGAQVISGVGFLGAGTIMKEGPTVRGLTTAASLWSIACLGLAAGGGAYSVAVLGTLAIFLTLSIMEHLQKRLPHGKGTRLLVHLECDNPSQALLRSNELAQEYHAQLNDFSVEETKHDTFRISYRLSFRQARNALNYTEFTSDLISSPCIIKLNTEEM